MKLSLNLTTMPLMLRALKEATEEIDKACKAATPSISPVGFEIDDSFCDWQHVSTSRLITIIDTTASQFGRLSGETYKTVVNFMCESLTEHFSASGKQIIFNVGELNPKDKVLLTDGTDEPPATDIKKHHRWREHNRTGFIHEVDEVQGHLMIADKQTNVVVAKCIKYRNLAIFRFNEDVHKGVSSCA